MDTIIWIIFWLLIVLGIAGVILPALPGFVLILGALIIHKIFMPDYFSNLLLGVAVLVFLLLMAVDFLSVLLAARLSGSGKWGMGGAGVGMALGFFYGLMGAIAGSLLGAFVGEKIFAQKDWWPSLKAGLGSAAGFLAAMAVKILLTAWIVIWIAVECLRHSFF